MLMWPDIIVHTYISLYDAIEHLRLGRYFVGMRYFIQKVKYLIFRQCLYILHLGFQLHFHPPPPPLVVRPSWLMTFTPMGARGDLAIIRQERIDEVLR